MEEFLSLKKSKWVRSIHKKVYHCLLRNARLHSCSSAGRFFIPLRQPSVFLIHLQRRIHSHLLIKHLFIEIFSACKTTALFQGSSNPFNKLIESSSPHGKYRWLLIEWCNWSDWDIYALRILNCVNCRVSVCDCRTCRFFPLSRKSSLMMLLMRCLSSLQMRVNHGFFDFLWLWPPTSRIAHFSDIASRACWHRAVAGAATGNAPQARNIAVAMDTVRGR